MRRTAEQVSSGKEERLESLGMASEIITSNGYTVRSRQSRSASSRRNVQQSENRIPLCLPFISDGISNAIKRCITQAQLDHDVILVNIPRENIKKQLVRNRLYDRACNSRDCVVYPYGKLGDCADPGTVYQIECLECHALYIGETGRPLSVRINEHMASKRRKSLISPLGKHRNEDHNGNDFDVKCRILAFESDISARKTLEAAWILTRNPAMNSRNEHTSITSDLMPFIGLCEL